MGERRVPTKEEEGVAGEEGEGEHCVPKQVRKLDHALAKRRPTAAHVLETA